MTKTDAPADRQLLDLFSARSGHFRFESGHHGNRWLELERLFLRPGRLREFAADLAGRLSLFQPEAVCGPLVEGAFLAIMVAQELAVDFVYSERIERKEREVPFSVDYRIPPALRGDLAGRRVAIVNDVINAGSAVQGTLTDLVACGATPVAIGTLLVLGSGAVRLAAEGRVALEAIASLPNELWEPSFCPLCAAGISLEDPGTRPTPD